MSDKVLSPERQLLYRELEHTFNTPGWRFLIQGWEQKRDSLRELTFFNAGDWDDVQHARIRFQLLNEIIDLPGEYARLKEAEIREATSQFEDESE